MKRFRTSPLLAGRPGRSMVLAGVMLVMVWAVTSDWRIGVLVALIEPPLHALIKRLGSARRCPRNPPGNGALSL